MVASGDEIEWLGDPVVIEVVGSVFSTVGSG